MNFLNFIALYAFLHTNRNDVFRLKILGGCFQGAIPNFFTADYLHACTLKTTMTATLPMGSSRNLMLPLVPHSTKRNLMKNKPIGKFTSGGNNYPDIFSSG